MAAENSNPLVSVYDSRIGKPATDGEAIGYWVFVVGAFAGFLGILMVMLSDSPGEMIRGAGIALAALGLLMLLIGPIIRLPLEGTATLLSSLGAVISMLAVGWFLVAFPDSWGAAFANQEVEIIGLYGVGVLVVALGAVFVPILTGPREEQAAAEERAAVAEAERDAAADEARERGWETTMVEVERDRLGEELTRIADSQSQFELYTDAGGKYRWRLRHRNRNTIADSAQGYSSRQKAQQGLSAIKRDAFGAPVVDLEQFEAAITAVDEDDEEAEDTPVFVPDAESKATFELYEDAAGDPRWRLRHDNGNIITDGGQGYSSTGSRDDAVERVRHYVQSADYLRVDPAAFEVYRDKGNDYRWRLLHENGNILADSGQGYSSRAKVRQGIESVQSNASAGGNAAFEVYEDAAGDYRWRLVHDNGNLIADGGQGYASESSAQDAVVRVREYAPDGHVLDIGTAAFEIYEDEGGEWRWRLRHRNGRIMADSSQGYSDRSGTEEGLHSVKQNAPNAGVEAVDE